MTEQKKKLHGLSNGNESDWLKKANHAIENEGWLQYSSRIALRILAAIEEREGMNQKKLAKAIGVKDQYISKIVQGQQNLSLKTIYKLSEALEVDLISFPGFKYSQPVSYFQAKIVPFNTGKSVTESYEPKSLTFSANK